MLVLLNGLQAGNLSGTGRYTTELVRRLPGLSEEFDFAIVWPRHVPRPEIAKGAREAFLSFRAGNALKRLYLDQVGLRTQQKRLLANVVHYPANVGNLFGIHNMVVTVHDLSFLHNPAWFRPGRAAYYRFAVGRSVQISSRVIADSQATAADLRELLGVEDDRIDVIPLGVGEKFHPVDEERRQAARAQYRLPERFFLYVGALEPRKNLCRVIEAWNRIASECPCDLVLAGRRAWKVGPIDKAASESSFADRIHFPGFISDEDLPAVLSAAHAFVWPSLCEGFGLPPLEAMACGTPVLTSRTSSLPEVVGDAAVVVDPHNVEEIASGMLELAGNGALRGTLRAKGLARAADFTWKLTAEKTIQTYRKVLSV